MAICPFATRKLIPPGANDPRIEPRVAILHVDAANSDSLYEYFKDRSGGIESHFHIKKTGEIEQYRDTDSQADANHLANDFAISIETQGFGEGEWTDAQLASIKRLLEWLNQVHPKIKLQKCPTWDGSGVGYHVQFGAPGAWTPVSKSCPGPDRIRQFNDDIVPWLERGGVTEEDEMQFTDKLYRDGRADTTVRELFQKLDRYITSSTARDKALRAEVAKLQKAVDNNADKAEIKAMLENLDAQITLVVGNEAE